MSSLTKQTSKLSTLDAASKIYFIIAGLAIKQSLGLFSKDWQEKHTQGMPVHWGWFLIITGYLATILRYSHGISLLHGHELDRIRNSTLASAAKVTLLSLFMVLMGTFFFLMADSVAEFEHYLFWTVVVLFTDLMYIIINGVARDYLYRPFRAWKETIPGYAAHAALHWIASDIIVILLCVLFYYLATHQSTLLFVWNANIAELILSGVLILTALLDYILNKKFYFGGAKDWRVRKRFIFVCSPLRDDDDNRFAANIRRAQFYSQNLMGAKLFYKFIPFAPHAFFTYFLDNKLETDRLIGRQCALAFLTSCDAIYVYVPLIPRWDLRKRRLSQTRWGRYVRQRHIDLLEKVASANPRTIRHSLCFKLDKYGEDGTSTGMKREIEEARKYGLYIKYLKRNSFPAGWKQTSYSPVGFKPQGSAAASTQKTVSAEGMRTRKRVYVCTEFRGKKFEELESQQQSARLKWNVRLALWHCHELARDPQAFIAPFAPQAFYPYFCYFIRGGKIQEDEWNKWFERSIDILKVCDAVYIYTSHGILHDYKDLSKGMRRIKEVAEDLGIEIQYPQIMKVPSRQVWNPAVPKFSLY